MNIKDPLTIHILMERGGDIDLSNEKPWWFRKSNLKSAIKGDFKGSLILKINTLLLVIQSRKN